LRGCDWFTPYRFSSLAARLLHSFTDRLEIIGSTGAGEDNHTKKGSRGGTPSRKGNGAISNPSAVLRNTFGTRAGSSSLPPGGRNRTPRDGVLNPATGERRYVAGDERRPGIQG